MKKIMIIFSYPAPYRTEIIKTIAEKYETDIFFLRASGDERNSDWFSKGKYVFIDTAEGFARYNQCVKNLTDYSLVVFYEFSFKEAVKLILKCRAKKVPYILNCDGVMLFRHGNFIRDIVKRILIKGATAYFASGEHAKDYFIKYGAKEEKIYFHNFTALHKKDILEKSILPEEKREIRKKLSLPINSKICIAVGRYIPLKRYDVLIRLWKDMPKDAVLLLIGGGPEKELYETIIKQENLSNVILQDFHPFDELLEYYRAADLFVHPTSYDVWGLVINEAMACGLPVIATDTCVAGLELIKNGENGFVSHLGDDKDFIEKVQTVLNDDTLRDKMSLCSIETIRPFYMENMIKSQIETIDTVVGEK